MNLYQFDYRFFKCCVALKNHVEIDFGLLLVEGENTEEFIRLLNGRRYLLNRVSFNLMFNETYKNCR